ncbi:hypothetical protein BDM02DRAFT_3187736 [Thelephora ganbajun]|uniref:Uncharacterized protein n=1 Tax=Thelephora ganbajun TaxID=370292 RepID=A0ACB6ZDR4_THEGA|nr:hypothetical protein BDM02DRAFT_3187736 [Thelephora ganbajun]
MMSNQRNILLKFSIAFLLATMTSALPTDMGMLQNSGIHLRCTENCNGYNKVLENNNGTGMGYSSNAGSTLSVTTGVGFMAMFLWTLLGLL